MKEERTEEEKTEKCKGHHDRIFAAGTWSLGQQVSNRGRQSFTEVQHRVWRGFARYLFLVCM